MASTTDRVIAALATLSGILLCAEGGLRVAAQVGEHDVLGAVILLGSILGCAAFLDWAKIPVRALAGLGVLTGIALLLPALVLRGVGVADGAALAASEVIGRITFIAGFVYLGIVFGARRMHGQRLTHDRNDAGRAFFPEGEGRPGPR